MSELIATWWQEIVQRPSGPMALRFYVQPTIALVLATLDGLRDARADKPAWLWSVFTDAEHRRGFLADGWRSIAKVVLIAIVLDVAYQIIVLDGLRPAQAVVVAVVVALVPYALVRGPANRLSRLRSARHAAARRSEVHG